MLTYFTIDVNILNVAIMCGSVHQLLDIPVRLSTDRERIRNVPWVRPPEVGYRLTADSLLISLPPVENTL
jgi:hypothetical protein